MGEGGNPTQAPAYTGAAAPAYGVIQRVPSRGSLGEVPHYVVCAAGSRVPCLGPTPVTVSTALVQTMQAPEHGLDTEHNHKGRARRRQGLPPKAKRFGEILFHFASTRPIRGQQDAIDNIISTARAHGVVWVAGYTDDIGPKAYNQGLALRRAERVKHMIKHTAPAVRVNITGHGKCCYQVGNATALERVRNRRAEVYLSRRQEVARQRYLTRRNSPPNDASKMKED